MVCGGGAFPSFSGVSSAAELGARETTQPGTLIAGPLTGHRVSSRISPEGRIERT